LKIQNKGPLYEFIKSYTDGNNAVIARSSLHDYYILSTAEAVLLEHDPDSEWTFRYPEDIQKSVRNQQQEAQNPGRRLGIGNLSQKGLPNLQFMSFDQENVNKAGTYPLLRRNQETRDIETMDIDHKCPGNWSKKYASQ
jgi:hypothetical protein